MSETNDPVSVAFTWWAALQHDKASAAQLRRATLQQAAMHEATIDLWRKLGYRNSGKLTRVAALASVLASVRDNSDQPFGRAIGREKIDDPSSALLKPIRFQNLMRIDASDEEFAIALRRAINIAGNKVRVSDIIRLVLFRESDAVRNSFAISYYGADVRAPAAA